MIRERAEAIDVKLDFLIEQSKRQDSKIEQIQKDVKESSLLIHCNNKQIEKHNHDLYGNGKKGLMKKVEDLEKKQYLYMGAIVVVVFVFKEIFLR